MIFILGKNYAEVKPDYFSSGDIFWVPKSNEIDFTALLLVENFSKDRRLGLINMIGHKAGRKYVALPNECLSDIGQTLSGKWLQENWDKWVALGRYEDAVFLRYETKLSPSS